VRQGALVGAATLFAISVVSGQRFSGAVFTDSQSLPNAVGTKRIFSAEHVTSGFDVRDASGGPEVDRSSQFAVAGDLRTVTTKAWAPGFSSSRYLQYDMSAPLPGGLSVSSPAFRLTFSSTGASTVCVYIEIRRISTDAVLATYGSSGSPAACVTGTTLTTLVQALPVVASTDLVDDLRVRVLGNEGGSGGMVVDEAVFTGSTSYVGFTTYPVRFTDAADGVRLTTPWELQGP
jgi:hypothetical protein